MEYIHDKCYIHRDIKPENFMSGKKEYKDVLYLIDFGLSKKYRDPKTHQHVKFVNNRRLNGTARYASIHALEGYETSRRDDLEELCYVLIYFLNGHLPWERIKNRNKHERYKLILNMKKKISEENLVGDKNNTDFIEFLKYSKKLNFEEKPDYNYLRGLMINCMNKNSKSTDSFYNIDIANNPLFHSQNSLRPKSSNKNVNKYSKKTNLNHIKNNNKLYLKDISQNISGKDTRCNSTKKIKIDFSNKKMIPLEKSDNIKNKEENNENEDYYNFDKKLINESLSSSLDQIEKKVRNYSSIKNQGIKDIHKKFFNPNQKSNKKWRYYSIINKNTTSFRTPFGLESNSKNPIFGVNVDNNLHPIKFDSNKDNNKNNNNKKYSRSKFSFIKKKLGFEPTDYYENLKSKRIICDTDDSHNIDDGYFNYDYYVNDNDDGCTIL